MKHLMRVAEDPRHSAERQPTDEDQYPHRDGERANAAHASQAPQDQDRTDEHRGTQNGLHRRLSYHRHGGQPRYHSLRMKHIVIAVALMTGSVAGWAQTQKTPEWSYTGSDGPEHWGDLSPEYSACKAGKEQSPIDIRRAERADLPPILFDYRPATLRLVNNGHTAQVNYPAGSAITVGGERYELKQFHFHRPSEERIGGKAFDMVIHLVHSNAKGDLTVVAVLLKVGPPSPVISKIFAAIPKSVGQEREVPEIQIGAADLLPADRGYYTYRGSLTTPPCSEGVTWLVLKRPGTVSAAQIKAFAALFSPNARPIQRLSERMVNQSR